MAKPDPNIQRNRKSVRENRVPVMMSDDELKAIDDWRFANRIATRSDAIRRLCSRALGQVVTEQRQGGDA